MYRFAERILTGSDNEYLTIKLYTNNAGRYSAGQYIISFTSGGQESSMPPGIRSYFDFPIG